MKSYRIKTMLGAFVGLALFAYQAPAARASGAVRIVSSAQLDSATPYASIDIGTCDPIAYPLPMSGDPACVATIGELYDATGDFNGYLNLEVTFTSFPDYSDQFADYQLWDGSLGDGRTGTFIVFEQGAADPNGNYTSELKVVKGTGTGDFDGVTGKGTSSGNLNAGVNRLKLKFPNN